MTSRARSAGLPVALAVLACLLPGLPARAGEAPESLTGVDLRAEHRARRAALAAVLGAEGVAVVPAASGAGAGLYAPRQEEDYLWLTGVDEPGGLLLLRGPRRPRDTHEEILLLPPRNVRAEGWIGPRLFPGEEAVAATGIEGTGDVGGADEALRRLLRRGAPVHFPAGASGLAARERLTAVIEAAGAKVRDLGALTGPLRLVKSAEEVARIRRAAEATAAGFVAAMTVTRAGAAEYEVQAALEERCRAAGCRRQAYDSIVASGPNACILHYGRNRRILEDGDLVLMDAGGEFLGYACDVTRTWPVGDRFTEEQARVYDAVLRAQEAGIAAAKPGATFKEITAACRKVLDDAGLGAAWRHGPCHWVGLNVHDPPGGDAPLAPGVVFVIEPGAYLPEKGFGVRIEDTFAMKADGTLEVLSAAAPKARAEIEALRAAALAGTTAVPK